MNSQMPNGLSAQLQVLLVDDETKLLRGLQRELEQLGFDIETASCAAEASVLLERTPIDAIVCDQRMPGTPGLSFLQSTLERRPDLVALLLTGAVGDLPMAHSWAREMGVKILAKPCPAETVAEELAQALERKRQSMAEAESGDGSEADVDQPQP